MLVKQSKQHTACSLQGVVYSRALHWARAVFSFPHLKLLINTGDSASAVVPETSGAEISAFQNSLSSWSSVAMKTPISNTYPIPTDLD